MTFVAYRVFSSVDYTVATGFFAYRVFSSVDYAAQCTCGYGVCRSAEDSFKFLKRVQNLNLGLGNVFFYFFIAKIEDKLNFFFLCPAETQILPILGGSLK